MYFKGKKALLFSLSLELVGLEGGPSDSLRPSLKKRDIIWAYLSPNSWFDINVFCYLTPNMIWSSF